MSFVTEAALIALREGLEAFLIVGILLGFVTKLGRTDARKWVWIGLGAGVAASVVLGVLVQAFLIDFFENRGGGEWFELVAALVAVGVLTYMVFWMWKHTRHLMVEIRAKVGAALEKNMLWVVATLVFFTVLREGLEVVLFYAALAQRNSAFDLVWSGLVGMALSIAIVVAIFATTTSFNLQKFFAATGILLVFVAAGLLVHSVHAATEVGILPAQNAIWDTSAALTDDSALGRILHALVGYTAQPTLLQALLYFGYLFGVGIPYLASLGTFRRKGTQALRVVAVGAVVLVVWLASMATVWGAARPLGIAEHGHDDANALGHAGPDHKLLWADAIDAAKAYDGKIGILIRDHGEIVEYNATTYEAVKEFASHMFSYSGLPPEILKADQGTWLVDRAHPFDPNPRTDAKLVDARLKAWDLPAIPYSEPPQGSGVLCRAKPTDRFYFVSGAGPGMGEPDILEVCGLLTYKDWLKMQNHSPRHEQGMHSWKHLQTHLYKHFGDKVVVAFAHGHDTKADANHTLEAAARYLVQGGATVVLDAYQSSVHSDAMNTCMMVRHAQHALHAAGFHGQIIAVGQAGHHELWGNATAEYAQRLVAGLPANTKVSIHLAQHGARPGSPNPCAATSAASPMLASDRPADQYHANLKKQFEVVAPIVNARLAERGNVTLRHVYGQGAGAADDGQLSPLEALALDKKDGIEQTIIIPYEFWGDALDNLVYLRESLGFTPERAPYYDSSFQTRTVHNGIGVLIASAYFGTEAKAEAELSQIALAIEGLAETQ